MNYNSVKYKLTSTLQPPVILHDAVSCATNDYMLANVNSSHPRLFIFGAGFHTHRLRVNPRLSSKIPKS